MKSTYTRLENGDYLIIYDFGDIRYTVRTIRYEQYYFLFWSTGDQETAFASIPYDDIHFFAAAWSLISSGHRPKQVYVLVGDTMEPVSRVALNKQITAQMLASHPIWCPVANMTQEHPFGPGGQEIKRGTSDIAPGAKVYCHQQVQGDGYERVQVTVHHRVSHRLVTIVTRAAWLEHWRVELVYEPGLIKRLIRDWDWTPESKTRAESHVELGKWWANKKEDRR